MGHAVTVTWRGKGLVSRVLTRDELRSSQLLHSTLRAATEAMDSLLLRMHCFPLPHIYMGHMIAGRQLSVKSRIACYYRDFQVEGAGCQRMGPQIGGGGCNVTNRTLGQVLAVRGFLQRLSRVVLASPFICTLHGCHDVFESRFFHHLTAMTGNIKI